MGSDDSVRPRSAHVNTPLALLLACLLIVVLLNSEPQAPQMVSSYQDAETAKLLATKNALEIEIAKAESEKSAIYSGLRATDSERAAVVKAENEKLMGLLEEQTRLEKLLTDTKAQAQAQAEEQARAAQQQSQTQTQPAPQQPEANTNPFSTFTPSSPDNPLTNPRPDIVHFPCPLRDLPPDNGCTLKCKDAMCSRAKSSCAAYVECTHVVYSAETSSDLTDATVTLMHQKRATDKAAMDEAFNALKSAGKISVAPRPRTYVIVSYGGSGSKMLSGWISDQPNSYVKMVRHMHDPNPPVQLHEFRKPINEASHQADYRNRHIPGGMFPEETALIPEDKYEDYRFIYIFKDPVEGLVSRYGYGHCMHVGGDCGTDDKNFPPLYEYAEKGEDWFKIGTFFNNWTTKSEARKYPVLAVNYHKIWDNVETLVEALGLPPETAKTFPARTETVRNDETAKKDGAGKPGGVNMAHTEEVRVLLREMYKDVRKKIFDFPAVSFV
jgi:hypothetical protein